MESNIKGVVSAGHEMASELKEECGAVDMRSVAKLISDLATQDEWVAYILPVITAFILRARLRVGIADTLLTGLASVRGGRASA
ncbi:hypothetical protein [Escherichia coli]|uniref:hypothetical protein n=1 Tax=Escherichia coli TaxID=562 RepID=UPI00207BDF25|nr:hypothetical protein [Escherichia coli]